MPLCFRTDWTPLDGDWVTLLASCETPTAKLKPKNEDEKKKPPSPCKSRQIRAAPFFPIPPIFLTVIKSC